MEILRQSARLFGENLEILFCHTFMLWRVVFYLPMCAFPRLSRLSRSLIGSFLGQDVEISDSGYLYGVGTARNNSDETLEVVVILREQAEFSNVSFLRNLLCELTIVLTFKNCGQWEKASRPDGIPAQDQGHMEGPPQDPQGGTFLTEIDLSNQDVTAKHSAWKKVTNSMKFIRALSEATYAQSVQER